MQVEVRKRRQLIQVVLWMTMMLQKLYAGIVVFMVQIAYN